MDIKTTQERRVVAYLKPKNDNLLRTYAEANEMSLSESVNIMVKDFFQRLPPEQRID